MGKMFEQRFTQAGFTVRVTGSKGVSQEPDLVQKSQLIIITVPIDKTIDVIRRITPYLRESHLLSDFTSIKSKVVPAMLETEAQVISCHPIFGPMNDFTGQNVVLCPARPGQFLDWYTSLYENLGLNVEVMDAEEHDSSMSFIQGLTHFIHIVFAQTLFSEKVDIKKLLAVCSPVYQANFAFLCRILSKDPHLYSCIQTENPKNSAILEAFIKNAQESLDLIKKKKVPLFEKNFMDYADYLGGFKYMADRQSDFLVEKLKEYNLNRDKNET